jgi:hypothetical protein
MGGRECIEDIGGKAKRKETHWEDQDVGGWTILKWILERYDRTVWCRLDWIYMAQDRD